MITSLARPYTTDPEHDRPRETPLPQRRPGGGTHDGRTSAERALGALLARDVANGDAVAAAAGRTAPRTVAQMRARLAAEGAR